MLRLILPKKDSPKWELTLKSTNVMKCLSNMKNKKSKLRWPMLRKLLSSTTSGIRKWRSTSKKPKKSKKTSSENTKIKLRNFNRKSKSHWPPDTKTHQSSWIYEKLRKISPSKKITSRPTKSKNKSKFFKGHNSKNGTLIASTRYVTYCSNWETSKKQSFRQSGKKSSRVSRSRRKSGAKSTKSKFLLMQADPEVPELHERAVKSSQPGDNKVR